MHNLIYLHGFNSAGNGTTPQLIQQALDSEFCVKAPSYPAHNPELSFNLLEQVVMESLQDNPNTVIAGTSLGGFWARGLSIMFELPVLMINPALKPGFQLAKYIGENQNFVTNEIYTLGPQALNVYHKLEQAFDKPHGAWKAVALLGLKDPLINAEDTIKNLAGTCQHVLSEELEHRVSPADIPLIASLLRNLAK